jgi:hypothetical protein
MVEEWLRILLKGYKSKMMYVHALPEDKRLKLVG